MRLIKKCICGNNKHFTESRYNGIDLFKCRICRIKHQKVHMTEKEYNEFYNTEYHSHHQTTIGCQPYAERYNHDVSVSEIRIKTYTELLGELGGKKLLDVGSGNGAFVDTCRQKGMDAWGIDLGYLGDPAYTHRGKSLLDLKLEKGSYNIITMHDVFEHLVDPLKHLVRSKEILKKDGHLIIDFPNYHTHAGIHHWRKIQHLWYFTTEELKDILEVNEFNVIGVHTPIPSKLVFYCKSS